MQSLDSLHPKDQIVYCLRHIYDFGLTTCSGGNISILDADNNLYITPSGTDKGTIKSSEICCIPQGGYGPLPKIKPSVELPIHRLVLKTRPDFKSIIHAHPSGLIAFCLVHKIPESGTIYFSKFCGKIAFAKYELPGTENLAKIIANEFKDPDVFCVMMENHAVVIGGKNLMEAYKRFECLEWLCLSELKAHQLRLRPRVYPNFEKLELEKKYKIGKLLDNEEISQKRKLLAEFAQRAYKQKLISLAFGEISLRLDEKSFLITSREKRSLRFTEDDILYVEMNDGDITVSKKESNMAYIHAEIYSRHADVQSIFISSPVNISSFCMSQKTFTSRLIPESYLSLRDIESFSLNHFFILNNWIPRMNDTLRVVMGFNFGVISTGTSIFKAFDNLEVMENIAESYINGCSLGRIVHLKEEQIFDLDEFFYGIKKEGRVTQSDEKRYNWIIGACTMMFVGTFMAGLFKS